MYVLNTNMISTGSISKGRNHNYFGLAKYFYKTHGNDSSVARKLKHPVGESQPGSGFYLGYLGLTARTPKYNVFSPGHGTAV